MRLYLPSGWSGCLVLVLDKRIFFKRDAASVEPFHRSLDIGNLPAHYGVLGRREFGRLGNADHGFAGLHDQRKLIVVHKFEAELAFIEFPGAIGVRGRNKNL